MRDVVQAERDTSLGNLVLSSGASHAIKRETLRAFRVRQRAGADPMNTDTQLEYLRMVVPTATEDELLDLSGPVIDEIVTRASLGIESAENLLGESSGARTESISTDSPPGTETPTSATDLPVHTD